ncbi:hypothetical protein AAVH_12135 [Aphelenchoides avenae]|nr:hypothetical protein AAVH_12135 [Aphelenchus avenae]
MLAIASLIRQAIEVVLLIFQSTVVVFLASHIARKNALFCTGFYKIFLSRCIVDMSVVAALEVGKVLIDSGVGQLALNTQHWAVSVMYFLNGLLITVSEMHEIAISVNRYTAFKRPLLHQTLWSGRCLDFIFLLLFTTPLAFTACRLLGPAVAVQAGDGISFIMTDRSESKRAMVIGFSVAVTTTLTCGYLDLCSFILYRRLSLSNQKARREDFRLLVCSAVQFVSQCVLTLVYISVAVFSQSDEQVATIVRPIVMPVFPYVLNVICLTSAPSLLFLSKLTRAAYVRFYRRQKSMPHETHPLED